MDVSVLVFAGILVGGVRCAPTPAVAPPELILQPPLLIPSVSVPVTYVSRHHAQDELGQVNYGFSHPGQAKNEVRDASGNVAGVYTYIDEENKIIWVEYTAGKDGFRVKSNNLPEGVNDTAEVLAAKLQFVEAYNAASLAAAIAADESAGEAMKSEDADAINIAFPVHVVQSPVKDTPEVIAAKLRFAEAYNAAALAAANAPDDPVEVSVDVEAETGSVINYNPVKDTPEVVAAKLQFVKAYNAAALAAAAAADNPEFEDSSEVIYASHPVQDTPEVLAAKLRFVEAYNAAAIVAALAPDDDVVNNTSKDDSPTAKTSAVTAKPLVSSEPVTDLGGSDADVAITSFPNEVDEAGEITTVFPGRTHDKLQDQTQFRKIHVLKPVKVTEPPGAENEALVSAVEAPQAHSYSVGPPVHTSAAESSGILTPTMQLTAPQLNDSVIGAPVTYVSRHHVQDELGQANFGFSYLSQAKNKVRDVQDTPDKIPAKLNFEEAYNTAAIAEENYNSDDSSKVVIVYATPVVQDTAEVIAAKLQFAAFAPDHAVQEDTTKKPGLQEEEVVQLQDNQVKSEDLHVTIIPEVSQSFDKPKEQFTIAYGAAPTIEASNITSYPAFIGYSSFPAGNGETSSAIYTNPLPSGVYALHVPLASANGFLPQTYLNRIPAQKLLPYQNYGSQKHVVIYAPTYTYV